MSGISVKGINSLKKKLQNYEKQNRFASAVALTKTAQKCKTAVQSHMRQVFSNPKPFTLNSLFVEPAKKNNPRIFARVGFKDFAPKGVPAAKYLQAQIKGGRRRRKRHERALIAKGLMPPGMYSVQGKYFKKNKYGHITGGQYTKMLSDLRASNDSYQNRTDKKSKFFVSRGGRLRRGVYQRTATGVKPMLIFVDKVNYRPRFKFHKVIEATWKLNFKKEFKKQMENAFRTAR